MLLNLNSWLYILIILVYSIENVFPESNINNKCNINNDLINILETNIVINKYEKNIDLNYYIYFDEFLLLRCWNNYNFIIELSNNNYLKLNTIIQKKFVLLTTIIDIKQINFYKSYETDYHDVKSYKLIIKKINNSIEYYNDKELYSNNININDKNNIIEIDKTYKKFGLIDIDIITNKQNKLYNINVNNYINKENQINYHPKSMFTSLYNNKKAALFEYFYCYDYNCIDSNTNTLINEKTNINRFNFKIKILKEYTNLYNFYINKVYVYTKQHIIKDNNIYNKNFMTNNTNNTQINADIVYDNQIDYFQEVSELTTVESKNDNQDNLFSIKMPAFPDIISIIIIFDFKLKESDYYNEKLKLTINDISTFPYIKNLYTKNLKDNLENELNDLYSLNNKTKLFYFFFFTLLSLVTITIIIYIIFELVVYYKNRNK